MIIKKKSTLRQRTFNNRNLTSHSINLKSKTLELQPIRKLNPKDKYDLDWGCFYKNYCISTLDVLQLDVKMGCHHQILDVMQRYKCYIDMNLFSKKSFYLAEEIAAFYEPVFEFNTLSILVRGEADRQNTKYSHNAHQQQRNSRRLNPKQPDKRSSARPPSSVLPDQPELPTNSVNFKHLSGSSGKISC